MASQVQNSDWLEWIERLAGVFADTSGAEQHALRLPRALYHCHLDDQPDFLVPARLSRRLDAKAASGSNWIFNPQCSFAPPDSMNFSDHEFASQNAAIRIIWVTDATTRSVTPYWLGPRLLRSLSAVRPGERWPNGTPNETLRVLAAAGIAVEPNHLSAQSAEWNGVTEVCRQKFRQNGYVPIAQLIHPFHLAALRRYYRYHLRHGNFPLGDSQAALRYVGFNEPVARFFHHQLAARISDLVGEPVKPSYCYFSCYSEGAVLDKHTDREQCEFSVSLCIDYSPEPDGATPWPLRLHIESGQTIVFQALGDALLYRGREIPHSRSRLHSGHSSTSLFFHFVRQDFAGPLN